MKVLVLLLALALSACVPTVEIERDSPVFVVGDSNCYDTNAWPKLAGFNRDCMWGRQTLNINQLPLVETLIFALGSNDELHDANLSDTRAQVSHLFSTTNADIYCLLPDGGNPRYMDVRGVLMDLCPNVLEPREMGFLFRALDGIHGIQADHNALALSMKEYFK